MGLNVCSGSGTSRGAAANRPSVKIPSSIIPINTKPIIFGSLVDSQTRTLIAICKFSSIQYVFKNTLEFTPQQEDEYAKLNPTKRLPVLQLGSKLIIGPNNIGAIHLCKTIPSAQTKLYQPELERRIENLLEWFHENMEIPGKKILKYHLQVLADEPSPADTVTFNDMNNIFLDGLKYLDQVLIKRKNNTSFFCSQRVTLADFVIYNEIALFLHVNEYDLDDEEFRKVPVLIRWFRILMPTIDAVSDLRQ